MKLQQEDRLLLPCEPPAAGGCLFLGILFASVKAERVFPFFWNFPHAQAGIGLFFGIKLPFIVFPYPILDVR